MQPPVEIRAVPPAGTAQAAGTCRARIRMAVVALFVSTAVLAVPWLAMLQATLGNSLHGYAAGIPAICAWLAWQRREAYRGLECSAARWPAAILGSLAAGVIAAGVYARSSGAITASVSFLTTQMLGWVLAVWAITLGFLGPAVIRRYPFPFFFLLFTIPLPAPAIDALEVFLQHGSAWAVGVALNILDVTHTRDAHFFWLPGLRFEIATECSGVRSTVVLTVVSILGAHVLLESRWRQLIIALVVLPLGIARNAFRICTLALLSVHVDPQIIDSPLHHKGGPFFFAISLIPLFALFIWFRRSEARRQKRRESQISDPRSQIQGPRTQI